MGLKKIKENKLNKSNIMVLIISNLLFGYGNIRNSIIRALYIVASLAEFADTTNSVFVSHAFFCGFCFFVFVAFFYYYAIPSF